MSTVYAPYAVRYETDAMSGTPALLGGITQQKISTNTDASQEAVAGSHYPFNVSLTQQKIVAEFTTRNIETALGDLAGPVDVLAGIGVEFYQVAKIDGVQQAGSTHRKAAIADGIIVPRRLSVSSDGHCELSYEVLARYDGTNNPLIFSESVAVPAETLADSSRFAMHTMQVGAVSIDGKMSLEVDFGVSAEQIPADGDVWAKYLDVSQYNVKITVKSVNTALVAAAGIPLAGKAGTQANSYLYLRKRDGGGFAAGSVHTKLSYDGLCYADDVFDARGNEKGECSLVTVVRYDGTNAPLLWALTEALP